MEKRVLLRRLEYMLDKLRSDMDYDINKVIESGCIDIEQAENDYKLPEAVFHAVLKREMEKHTPTTPYGRKETNNIYKFI